MEGNGRAEDGGTVGDGDAMRYGSAAVDGPHTGAHSFYSHRIGGHVGRGGRCGGRTSHDRDRNVMWTGASGRTPEAGRLGISCVLYLCTPYIICS